MEDKLFQVCKFIYANDKNSDILDCYEQYYDQAMDRNTLIEICQEKLKDDREVPPEYKEWLGL